MARRVVVTGMGAVTPCGNDAPTTWQAMLAGQSGVAPIRRFDATALPVTHAAEVKGFDADGILGRKMARRLDLFAQYAMVAADEAFSAAGIQPSDTPNDRVGVYIGTGIGGLQEIVAGSLLYEKHGWKGLSPFFIPRALTNLAAGHVAIKYAACGPSLCVTTACATGNHSIGEAWRVIRAGDADIVVAGGAEGAVTAVGIAGFAVMRALSRRNDPTASRPFDRERDGFVMGEGAGVVVLEELEHAKKRGAHIYGEVAGYALNGDAYHMTAPSPDGEGAAHCMASALRDARVKPEEVGYINAHGTSTELNDKIETLAIKKVFGDQARKLQISSTKSMTGHTLGAAGGIEFIACCLSLKHQTLHPTINYKTLDPECDLDYIPNTARKTKVEVCLSNSLGFGGHNTSIIVRKFKS